ncbi:MULTISPECIES: GNAT family N-acetyltransferase [unclassified Novosphingobium]|uniref:GNAT family N-acetyltransferase n=1 Tax=unclassified Novosphingobium TaxID=2644732 RepID=UPI001359BA04|nr:MULTISPECIES: GNAT family N-acetyltransferase [unclassified Novosphingobium]
MFIRSERLFLRPGWAEDWEELLGLLADEAVVRNLANVPWPYTAEDARSFIAMPQDHLLPRFLITVPSTDGARLVGGCGLSLLDGEVNLGYWIARGEWGQGYASEAARSVLGLAHTLGHRRVVASHYVDNAASGRVLEKVGFRRTGRVIERFGKGRGFASPTREYEVRFDSPGYCDDDDDAMAGLQAA